MELLIKIITSWQSILLGAFWLGVMVSIIAFVHEFGHYLAARACGVRVEAFAIGMGKEIFGFTSKKTGTRWKFCLFPIGGYVQMLGQSDTPQTQEFKYDSEDEKKVSFEHKKPWQKIVISVAGPFANFVLAFCILFSLYAFAGKYIVKPIVSEIVIDSPAKKSGLKIGDKIVEFNGKMVTDFKQIVKTVALSDCENIDFIVKRGEKDVKINILPIMKQDESLGKAGMRCFLGIGAKEVEKIEYSFSKATAGAYFDTVTLTKETLIGIGQIVSGKRSIKELSGPLKIGKLSHEASKEGLQRFVLLIVLISIGVGVMNLLPIPVLDGGHIVMNLIAIVIRKDVPAKIQILIYRFGFFIVIAMMCTGFVNDFLYLIK